MKRLLILFFLIAASININAQQKFYFEADSCLYELRFKIIGMIKKGSFEFSVELYTFNYSSTDRYFVSTRSTKAINLVFSELNYKSSIVSFFIGGCNEDAFPLWCDLDSLSLLKLPSKSKLYEEYSFYSQRDINEYLRSSNVRFIIRTENIDCLNERLDVKNYHRCSKVFKTSINVHKQKQQHTSPPIED